MAAEKEPVDAEHARPAVVATVVVADAEIDVVSLRAYLEADLRRASSFVTNFGNWLPTAAIAEALGADRCRLEWVHDTGELVLLGGVPHLGEGGIDVPRREGEAEGLPAVLGGTAVLGRSEYPGMVREYFAAEQLPGDARVAVLGVVVHGPRVHELLWGWHEHHRHADGWDWLVGRFSESGVLGRRDDRRL